MATGKGDIHRMGASGAKLFAMINMGVSAGPDFLRVGERMPVTANLLISNPYGIPKPLFLNGSKLEYFMPLVGPSLGVRLTVGFMSYADETYVMLISTRGVVPHVDRLVQQVQRSFRKFERAYGKRAPRKSLPPVARKKEAVNRFARAGGRNGVMRAAILRTFAADGTCTNPTARLSFRARLLIWFYRRVFKPRFPKRVDLPRAREALARLDRRLGGFRAAVRRAEVHADGVSGEWVTTDRGTASRTILYLHGGGFMFRTPLTHAGLAARLCDALDARAFVARYRLAPEHPLPAAHEDCFAAYRWLLATGHDPRRIVVAGDSAGGLLVLAVLQRIRDADLPGPGLRCNVLTGNKSRAGGGPRPIRDQRRPDDRARCSRIAATARHRTGRHARSRRFALRGQPAGLPPLLFQAGSTELLLEQSRKAFLKARASGSAAELQVWPEMPPRIPGGAVAARIPTGSRVRPRLRRTRQTQSSPAVSSPPMRHRLPPADLRLAHASREQAKVAAAGEGFVAAGDAEFAVDVLQVPFDGSSRNTQRTSNLLVGQYTR